MLNNVTQLYTRGMIAWANLGEGVGSRQGGMRPVVIIQNNVGNKFSPTVIVSAITSKVNKKKLPTHVELNREHYSNLHSDSLIMLEQVATLDKRRLGDIIGYLTEEDLAKLNLALEISVGLGLNCDKKNINKETEQRIYDLVKHITVIDGFIIRSLDKGTESSQICSDFSERHSLLCELKFVCERNDLDIKQYYDENNIKLSLACV